MISSTSNKHYKKLLSLLHSTGIKDHKQFLVFGKKTVLEILAQNSNLCVELITFPGLPLTTGLPKDLPRVELSKTLFKTLDIFNTQFPILVVKTWNIPQLDLSIAPSGFEILCPIGDPRNLGALLRSSFALGASKIILLQEACSPFLPHSTKVACGSLFQIKIFRGPTLRSLKTLSQNPQYYALDFGGTDISKFIWPQDLRLVIGEEGPGFKGLHFKNKLTIAQVLGAHSLNVTTATSIALFSYRNQFPVINNF